MVGQEVNNNLSEQFLEEKVTIGLPWRLMFASLFIFIFTLFVYFGLKFGYGSYLENQIKNTENDLNSLIQRVSADDQEKLVSFYSQIFHLKKILTDYSYASNIFVFLEKNVLSDVYFTNVDFKNDGLVVGLDGYAKSLETLAQQAAVFEETKDLLKLDVEKIALVNNMVSFRINLNFKEDFFKRPINL